jgi:hypothetical protein
MHAVLGLVLVALLMAQFAVAQDTTSKIDLFAGYSAYHPGSQAANAYGGLGKVPAGFTVAARYNFTKNFSLAGEAGKYIVTHVPSSNIFSLAMGPQYRFQYKRFTPFAEVLLGAEKYQGSKAFSTTLGGGVDYRINKWLSWRAVQADYIYTTHKLAGHTQDWNGERIQTGVVLNLFDGKDVFNTVNLKEPDSKLDLFAGASVYRARGISMATMPYGYDLSASYKTYKNLYVAAEASEHMDNRRKGSPNVYTMAFGPQYKVHIARATPFAETLLGVQHFNGTNNFQFVLGGGVDTALTNWLSFRVVQADYVHSGYKEPSGFNEKWNGARLQSGLVFNLFNAPQAPEVPATASLSVEPGEVFAGEPVKAAATGIGFAPKSILSYTWGGNGPKVSTAAGDIDTAGLLPGSYPVTVSISDNGKGKHLHVASAQGSFTVKERPQPKHPPVIASLTAEPANVKPGQPVSVNCNGSSPDNRPLSYSYTASAGSIGGNTSSTTLETSGLPSGSITVNCQVSDDRGLSDSKSTSVEVVIPPPPPAASKLNTIAFSEGKPTGTARASASKTKPARVDNAAKAVLDDAALRLQREPSSTAVIVGYGKDTKTEKHLAARRALNAKYYMVSEKGLDAARIAVRSSDENKSSVDIWIIPAGATFNGEGTSAVDSSLKADAAPVAHKAAHKSAHKAAKKAAK